MANPTICANDFELYIAIRGQNWTKCIEILRTKPVNPNINYEKGWNCLHFAVYTEHRNQFELVQLLLQQRANPFALCDCGNNFQVSSIQMSIYFRPNPKIVQLLTSNFLPELEGQNLLGCCLLQMGETQKASNCFFGPTTNPRFNARFERWVNVTKSMVNLTTANVQLLFCTMISNQQNFNDINHPEMITYLIQFTDFSYTTVAFILDGLLQTRNFKPQTILQIAKIICNSTINPNREPQHLYNSIIKVANEILHSVQQDKSAEQLIWRLGFTIGRFEAKNHLLVSEKVLQAPMQLVPFLLNWCGCNPNFKNQDGATAMHLLLKDGAFWDQNTRNTVSHAVFALLNYKAHPCVRNAQGKQVFEMFWKLGWPAKVRPLLCIAASKVAEAKIDYGNLSDDLKKFMELH